MSGVEEAALLAALAEGGAAAGGAEAAGAGAGALGAGALGAGAAGGAAGAGAGLGAAGTAGLTAEELAAMQAAGGGLMSAAPSAGVVAPGMQYAAMADTGLINAGYPGMAGGKMTGLLGSQGAAQGGKALARQYGTGLMNQQPQQQRAPMLGQQPQQAPTSMYGPGSQSMYGMDEETKRKLREMGYRV